MIRMDKRMTLQRATSKCPNCGAKIDLIPDVNGLVSCEYCDHQYRVQTKKSQRRSHQKTDFDDASDDESTAPSAIPPARPAFTPAKKTVILSMIAVFMFLSIIAVFLQFQINAPSNRQGDNSASALVKAARSVAGVRTGWDSVGGPPQIVRISGEEHLIGRLRVYGADELSIRVIRTKDLTERWATPTLGIYSESYQAIHFAAAQERLLVSDGRNKLHVYDLDSGQDLKIHSLTDRAERFCVLEESSKIWIKTLDKRHIIFDLSTFDVQEAKRPASCPKNSVWQHSRPEKIPASKRPKVDDFKPMRLFVDGQQAVLFGAKSPGTAVPIAVGFNPEDKEIRWKKSILQVDPNSFRTSFYNYLGGVAGGRFVTFYGVGSDDEWRVLAFDAGSGVLLWETTLRPIFAVDKVDGITVSPDYVYVVRSGSVDVLKASSGQLIGAVGDETYD